MFKLLALLSLTAHATDAPDVNAPHGPTHQVDLSLSEGTWMSVTVHGDTLVFDLLGDLWSLPLAGGEATQLTSGPAWDVQPSFSPDGQRVAFTSDRDGNENAWTMAADGTDARALTSLEVDRVTHPTWDPDHPDWLVVRRRSVDTRSIGVTELWSVHLSGGEGVQLTTLDEHPHAGEPWIAGEDIYFSSRYGRFNYGQDPTAGLWEIDRLDRDRGEVRTVARGAGSASHPMISPDGRTMVFITRVETHTQLHAMDLATGKRRLLLPELSDDELEGFALHGTYPRMDWTPSGDLVYWAQGRLWRLNITTGEKQEIPFHLRGSWTLHDVARPQRSLPDTVAGNVVRWPTLSTRGATAFSSVGRLWVRTQSGEISQISEGLGFAPRWSPDGEDLAWTSWSDTEGGSLQITWSNGETERLPVEGQLLNPAWTEDGASLVALRGRGGDLSRDLVSEPWYEVILVERAAKRRDGWTTRVLGVVDNRGPRAPRLHVRGQEVWFFQDVPAAPREPNNSVLRSLHMVSGEVRDHLTLPGVEEVALSPDLSHVAWKQDHQLFLAAMPPVGTTVASEALPSRQLTQIVGDWIDWTPDGDALTWMEGPLMKQISVAGLLDVPTDDKNDDAKKDEENKDILKELAGISSTSLAVNLPRQVPEGSLVLKNARVITMEGEEVLEGVDVVIEGDRITAVSAGAPVPPGAREVDCTGKTIMPGLIDVHAHLHFSAGDILPEQPWRYQVALDYGVTTVHDPSVFTDQAFTQAEEVEAGFIQGPRVLSTGRILYGAKMVGNAETPSKEAAIAHVRRLKAIGAGSVKVYQQSQRQRRQWYAEACREEAVLCVPEGGGDLWMNLTMVADGYHTIEHSLPIAPLYEDVVEFFAASAGGEGDGYGTFNTPTLQVAYGGLAGRLWFEQERDPYQSARLRRHTPADVLSSLVWRRGLLAREGDWHFREVATAAERLRAEGAHITLGAHGELQGLGVHWELQALGGPQAMSAHHALQAGTIEGARYLGMDHLLGSVKAGKLADLIILEANPLENLEDSTQIAFVVKNGAIWEE